MNVQEKRCLICTDLTYYYCQITETNSKYSEVKIHTLIEKIISENVISEADIVCQNCLMKIDEYDLNVTTAKKLEKELKDLYYSSIIKSTNGEDSKVEYKSPDQLDESEDDVDFVGEYKVEYLDDDKSQTNEKPKNESTTEIFVGPRIVGLCEQFSPETSRSIKVPSSLKIVKKRIKVVRPKLISPPKPIKPTPSETVPQSFMCDVCGVTMQSRHGLILHKKNLHETQQKHSCTICEKTFTQRGALVRHYPIHTGDKPYQCEKCGKQFLHYSSFHMHELAHSDIREKKCEICGLALRSTSHLNRHMRIHSGEKPFACPTCGQRFAQRYNMTTHYKVHQGIHRTSNRNHKCLVCSATFPRKGKLEEHMQTAHQTMMSIKQDMDIVDSKQELPTIMDMHPSS